MLSDRAIMTKKMLWNYDICSNLQSEGKWKTLRVENLRKGRVVLKRKILAKDDGSGHLLVRDINKQGQYPEALLFSLKS